MSLSVCNCAAGYILNFSLKYIRTLNEQILDQYLKQTIYLKNPIPYKVTYIKVTLLPLGGGQIW